MEGFSGLYDALGRIGNPETNRTMSEASSRQLHRRARHHIQPGLIVGSGDEASAAQRGRGWSLLDRFLRAVQDDDLAGLEELLSAEVTGCADGGGAATAARRPVFGRARVARYLVGALAKFGAGVRVERAEINGRPALLGWSDAALLGVLVPAVGGDRVVAMFGIAGGSVRTSLPIRQGALRCPAGRRAVTIVRAARFLTSETRGPRPMTPTILATGGTGTLGRAVVETALAAGHEAGVLSRRQATSTELPYAWLTADLRSGEGVAAALTGADVVIHCATTHGRGDVQAAQRLLDAAQRAGTGHLIYISHRRRRRGATGLLPGQAGRRAPHREQWRSLDGAARDPVP